MFSSLIMYHQARGAERTPFLECRGECRNSTAVPGAQRVRRYEDVEHLRDHRIDVLTTVNIQHLESLQDVVHGITGVAVRETLPDAVFGVTERVLVIADGHDRWGAVLRSAWRLASALDGELIVVTTRDPPSTTLRGNILLAEDLGARTVTVDASMDDLPSLVDALVELIERERISVAVAGVRIEEPRWNRRTRGVGGAQWAIDVLARVNNLEVSLVRIDRPSRNGPDGTYVPD